MGGACSSVEHDSVRFSARKASRSQASAYGAGLAQSLGVMASLWEFGGITTTPNARLYNPFEDDEGETTVVQVYEPSFEPQGETQITQLLRGLEMDLENTVLDAVDQTAPEVTRTWVPPDSSQASTARKPSPPPQPYRPRAGFSASRDLEFSTPPDTLITVAADETQAPPTQALQESSKKSLVVRIAESWQRGKSAAARWLSVIPQAIARCYRRFAH